MPRAGMTPDGKKRQVGLHNVAEQLWASPSAHDGRRPGSDATSIQGTNLKRDAELWSTLTSRDWRSDSSQKSDAEIYGTKGRPLGRQAPRSGIGGPLSSPAGPTSPRLWKTPHGIGNKGRTGNIGGASEFQKQVRIVTGKKRLNPLFVEWLMGLPVAWTDFAPLATPSCPPKPLERGNS